MKLITILAGALFLCNAGLASATTLTGAILFSADANGSYIETGPYGTNVWTTRSGYNNGAITLFMKSGPGFVNADGSGNLSNLSIDLQPGQYTFDYFANGFTPFGKNYAALNLFFYGSTRFTGITALNTLNGAGNSVTLGLSIVDDTLALDANTVFADSGTNAHSLVYNDGINTVTLTSFNFLTPVSTNLVSDGLAVPDNTFDSTGSFTLNVVSLAPEPGTFVLLGTALAGFGLYRFKRRK